MPASAATTPTSATPTKSAASSVPAKPQNEAERDHKIHCILTGKGGVGKTFAAYCLVQFLRDKGVAVDAIDTDPVNRSLHGFAGLGATTIPILKPDHVALDVKGLDRLSETILTSSRDFVIDNGAASFLPFGSYLADAEFADFAAQNGRELIVHAVVSGGPTMVPTLLGLDAVFTGFPEKVQVVVWLNGYFGSLELKGKSFEAMDIYTNNAKRIRGVVQLPDLAAFGFRPNVEEMLTRTLTFQEAIDSPDFMLLEKQRLVMVRRAIWAQLDKLGIV